MKTCKIYEVVDPQDGKRGWLVYGKKTYKEQVIENRLLVPNLTTRKKAFKACESWLDKR